MATAIQERRKLTKNRKMKFNQILKVLGIIFSVIVILVFIDWTLENAIEGWNNPF